MLLDPRLALDHVTHDGKCGHDHAVARYAAGCRYATDMVRARAAVQAGNLAEAEGFACRSDEVLSRIADLDADDLRDFIAGANFGLLMSLRPETAFVA